MFVRATPNGDPILFGTLQGAIDFGGYVFRAFASPEVGAQAFVTRLNAMGDHVSSAIATMNTLSAVAVDAQGGALVSGRRFNPSWPRLNQFPSSGFMKETTVDSLLLPFSQQGSAGPLAVDQAGNVYWTLSTNAQNGSTGYLVKLVP